MPKINSPLTFPIIKELHKKFPAAEFNALFIETEGDFLMHIRKCLREAVRKMEESAKDWQNLNENGYTSILAQILEGHGLSCKREVNLNGHIDLYISCPTIQRTFVGEAKKWTSRPKYKKAFEQVLSLYQTGRFPHALIIIYYTETNEIWERQKSNMEDIQADPDGWFSCKAVKCEKEYMRGAFLTSHAFDSVTTVEILHVGCNLYYKIDS